MQKDYSSKFPSVSFAVLLLSLVDMLVCLCW